MFLYSEDIRLSYEFKNIFYDILEIKEKDKVRQQLIYWIEELKESNLKEFKDCIRAFRN